MLEGRLASAAVTGAGLLLKRRDGAIATAKPPAGAGRSFVQIASAETIKHPY
jgi:hypothetical protein